MKRLENYQRLSGLENNGDVVRRLIGSWTPTSFRADEKTHEQDLYSWLKRNLPDVPMKSQYGIAWGTADIVIQDEHVIELKVAFKANGVGEFDRCLGQLWRYKEKWVKPKDGGRVWLVTVGESEAEFRHLIQKWIAELNGHFFTSPFAWIEKVPG